MKPLKALVVLVSVVAIPLLGFPLDGIRRLFHQPDWLQFNSPEKRDPRPITPDNIGQLQRLWRVKIPGVSDSSPLYVTNVSTKFGIRDVVILALTNGGLIALTERDGKVVWTTTPPEGPRWTTASPAIDPNRLYVYAYALDGYVHKYKIEDGTEITTGGWPELITDKGDVEKGSSAISIATARDGNTYLYMAVAGYPDPGDEGDYQGHLTTINLATGVQHTFNAACSDRDMHFLATGDTETDCNNVQAGIWARAGAVYDASLDRVFVTTGNGVYDAAGGGYNWGSSILALRPDGTTDHGTPLDSYTPAEYQLLTDMDWDLGSSTVAPLPVPADSPFQHLAAQVGKDWKIRMVDLSNLSGRNGPRHVGGEVVVLPLPQLGEMFARPATWLDPDTNTTWIYFTNDNGVSAMQLVAESDGKPTLQTVWQRTDGGSSAVIANGVLYFARNGEIDAVNAITGDLLWSDTTIGPIHWASPIVTGGNVYIADVDGYVTAYTILHPSVSG